MESKRFFIELSYEGTDFHGWQIQSNANSVQACLEQALSVFFRQKIELVGCGRTDTGVHASQYFAHFDLIAYAGDISQTNINGINALLPYSIAVYRVFEVAKDAHARFDATYRTYNYFIHFRKEPFLHQRSWLYRGGLDIELMNMAAQQLLNYTDFSCFSKLHTQTFTNNCTINEAFFVLKDDKLVFTITANRFLRNMVRAIVGTLVLVGKGSIKPDELKKIIESKNRSNAGQSVPACGLYLSKITYPYL